ncbi:hypothetical protein D9Q98_003670 [Chlorella vulgaris]|uniref:Uncharacterized protein n=1 Tax=Chlorella vulgaris TaxID=3077 RepID=A0A9D4TT93_CHLVU|nr:hypothetical protein D9Q98_003670 [Chlorella vulgaris]
MAPAAARAIATVVAEVCDMDSSSTSHDGMVPRINSLWGQLDRAMAGSPDAETVSALDRAIEAGARRFSALGTRLTAVVHRGNAAALAAPEPLVAWLSAAVRTTLALSGPLQKTDKSVLQQHFASLVNSLCVQELFQPHADALQQRPTAQPGAAADSCATRSSGGNAAAG